jgi:nucleoside-diphosphate-sugar epimerase
MCPKRAKKTGELLPLPMRGASTMGTGHARIVFGCGYLGRRVANRWRDAGSTVHVVSRDVKRAADLQKHGFCALVGDITQPATLKSFGEVSTVLFAVGYDRNSQPSIEEVYVHGLANVLAALPDSVERLIYISSTGVYGPSGEDWLDEASPCKPTRAGGKACLAAERLLSAHPIGKRSVVLRLAGIYGPERVPQRAALLAGQVSAPPLDSYLNLIHVDDAVDCILAVDALDELPNLFIVADGNPVRRRDYYREVLRLAGLEESLLAKIRVNGSRRGRGGKRVNNAKMRRELNVTLKYSDYRAGLADVMNLDKKTC